jgi:hypothetical protein
MRWSNILLRGSWFFGGVGVTRNYQDMSSRNEGGKCLVIVIKTIWMLKVKIFGHYYIMDGIHNFVFVELQLMQLEIF